MTAQPGVPRVLGLLAFLALLWWLNREAPGVLPAILVLVALYLVVTHEPKVAELVGTVPGWLTANLARDPRTQPVPRPGVPR